MSDNQDINLEDMVFFEEEEHGDIPLISKQSENEEEGTVEDIVEETPEEDSSEDVIEEDEDEVTSEPELEDLEAVDPQTQEADQDSQESEDDAGQNELSGYFNFMKENNLLLLDDEFEFDGTEEGFETAIKSSQENLQYAAANQIWQQLPEDFQTLLEYGLNGGTDINKVKQFVSNNTDLNSLDLEDIDVQEQVVTNYLKKTTKFSDSKIIKHIERLKDLDMLEEEAVSAKPELKQMYDAEKQELLLQSQKEEEEHMKLIEDSYNSFVSTVTELELPKEKQQKIVNAIWKQGHGEGKKYSYFNYIDSQIRNNPEHLAQLVELYLDYDSDKGFTSDRLKKKVKSEVNRGFRDSLNSLGKGKGPMIGGKKPSKKRIKSASNDLELWRNNRI